MSFSCTKYHGHVHLVGGRAAAAQENPKKLCEAISSGIANQKANDLSRKFTTLPMCEKRVASLASLCREATGHLSSLCREATGDNNKTDWPAPIDQPIGDYPKHWADGIHDRDGHALGSSLLNTDGESLFLLELHALMCQNGVEYACDDVSNAALDLVQVRQARSKQSSSPTSASVLAYRGPVRYGARANSSWPAGSTSAKVIALRRILEVYRR